MLRGPTDDSTGSKTVLFSMDRTITPALFSFVLAVVNVFVLCIVMREPERNKEGAGAEGQPGTSGGSNERSDGTQRPSTRQPPESTRYTELKSQTRNAADRSDKEKNGYQRVSTIAEDRDTDRRKMEEPQQSSSGSNDKDKNHENFPLGVLLVSQVIWFLLCMGLALFETVIVPITTANFHWDVQENGTLITLALVVGVICMVSVDRVIPINPLPPTSSHTSPMFNSPAVVAPAILSLVISPPIPSD